jgi:hypothetical protein
VVNVHIEGIERGLSFNDSRSPLKA